MRKEETRNSKIPRKDANDFVTDKGKNNLQVDKWLDAGRPGKGKTPEPVQATMERACDSCLHKILLENVNHNPIVYVSST